MTKPVGDRLCKRCGSVKSKDQFTSNGSICYSCKQLGTLRRDERRLTAQVAYYVQKLNQVKEEICRLEK